MHKAATHAGVVPPADLVAAARAHVDTHGIGASSRSWEVSRQALVQLLAGLRVRRGTVVLVAQGLRWPGALNTPTTAA